MATSPPTFDVFLSHNSKDKAAVRELAEILKSHSLNPWLDESDLPLGQTWQPEAEHAIRTVRSALVLVGPHGLGPWQAIEAQSLVTQSINRHLPVIPVLLPGTPDKPDIPTFLAEYTRLDLRAGLNDQAINRLIQTIRAQQSPSPYAPQRISPSRLPRTSEHLIGRDDELNRLHSAWSDRNTHVLTLVAWGGVGKTALISRWAAQLAQRNYDHADCFDWSFYSQGSHEHSAASADLFINKALTFFGDPDLANSPAAPWDKGARLAHLIAQRRTLLILDGLEPLQHPPGPFAGQLKDPALLALLRGLAQRNPGLCLITTRQSLADLDAFKNTTAPQWNLEHLSTPATIELLKRLGVHGLQQEFESLATDVKGHALTLNLLGRYLAEAHHGDIRRRDLVRFEEADAEIQGGHAFRVIAAYERWFGGEGEGGLRALAILRLMGLFDRPADAGCINALRQPPAIPTLTDPLINLTDAQWNLAVTRLASCGLISIPSHQSAIGNQQSAIDSHPLIREYFATQLKNHHPDAWRSAHRRLYEHLTASTKDKPNPTLEDLQPLYQAVAHGCQAELYGPTFRTVFVERILRSDYYTLKRLGAPAADLAGLACFFSSPWTVPEASLFPYEQAAVLCWAGIRLRALGRMQEAKAALLDGLRRHGQLGNWECGASTAGHLFSLTLVMGRIEEAVGYAHKGIKHADGSGVPAQRVYRRATLGYALHQAGDFLAAETSFRDAEALHHQFGPNSPALDLIYGLRFCELLLEQGKVQEAAERALRASEQSRSCGYLLDIGYGHLVAGLIGIKTFSTARNDARISARRDLDDAVRELRKAVRHEHLVRALLARAQMLHLQGEVRESLAGLDEAWEIASRGPMRLYMADILLTRARLFKDPKALQEARNLIQQCGYHRRDQELADAEQAATSWPSP